MLIFVPNIFAAHDTVPRRLRLTLQCLVAFADDAGRVRYDARKFAQLSTVTAATIRRHVAELVKAGVVTREGPLGRVVYRIDPRFMVQPEGEPC